MMLAATRQLPQLPHAEIIALSSDGSVVVLADLSALVDHTVWSVDPPRLLSTLAWSGRIRRGILAAALFVGEGAPTLCGIHIWDTVTGETRLFIKSPDPSVHAVSASGRWLAASDTFDRRTTGVYCCLTGERVLQFERYTANCELSPDDRLAAWVTCDSCHVEDILNRTTLCVLPLEFAFYNTCMFLPDSRLVAPSNGIYHIWGPSSDSPLVAMGRVQRLQCGQRAQRLQPLHSGDGSMMWVPGKQSVFNTVTGERVAACYRPRYNPNHCSKHAASDDLTVITFVAGGNYRIWRSVWPGPRLMVMLIAARRRRVRLPPSNVF